MHFQKPANIVSYYQQIGRAGRGIEYAVAILLRGGEDDQINEYFIESAFPTEELMNGIIEVISDNPGLKISELERHINMKKSRIKQCINYLLVNGDIYADNNRYYKTARIWKPDIEKSKKITGIRRKELQQMERFTKTRECYMEYIAKELDDPKAKKCGKCANCLGHSLVSEKVPKELVTKAQQFIRQDFNVIIPRKMWPSGERIDGKNKIPEQFLCEVGRVLSNYGDAGWGRLVSAGKYQMNYFGDQLVNASGKLLKDFVEQHDIVWITSIPSIRHPELVRSFAERLARWLDLQYVDAIKKIRDAKCQKELNTNYLQYKNAYDSFVVENPLDGNVLVVDDMVDSGWTFTVCGYKLRVSGSGKIFPFALANSAGRSGEE